MTIDAHCRSIDLVATLAAIAFASTPTSLSAASGDIVLQVMASPAGFAEGASPGHSFMCLAYHLNSGVKEECFGFYPRGASKNVFIGGPGIVAKEYEKNPARFAIVAESFSRTISADSRNKVATVLNQFNQASYKLTEKNCIDLVDRVAAAAGWKLPERSALQSPVAYLKSLKQRNTP